MFDSLRQAMLWAHRVLGLGFSALCLLLLRCPLAGIRWAVVVTGSARRVGGYLLEPGPFGPQGSFAT